MSNRSTVISMSEQRAPVNEKLMSVEEAADYLGLSKSWIYQSDIPRVKLGRRRLYRPSDLNKYVSARVSHQIPRGDS